MRDAPRARHLREEAPLNTPWILEGTFDLSKAEDRLKVEDAIKAWGDERQRRDRRGPEWAFMLEGKEGASATARMNRMFKCDFGPAAVKQYDRLLSR